MGSLHQEGENDEHRLGRCCQELHLHMVLLRNVLILGLHSSLICRQLDQSPALAMFEANSSHLIPFLAMGWEGGGQEFQRLVTLSMLPMPTLVIFARARDSRSASPAGIDHVQQGFETGRESACLGTAQAHEGMQG